MRLHTFIAALLCCGLLAATATPALTAQTPAPQAPAPPTHAQLRLIAEEVSYLPGKLLWVGVLFRMDPGWHIYWQNPGDSGTPPIIRWSVPRGFQAGDVHWPRPMRLGKGTVVDYGYEGQVLLMTPIASDINTIGAEVINANVKYVVCRDICVPEKTELSLTLPQSSLRTEHFSSDSPLFQSARAQFPRHVPREWDVSAEWVQKGFNLSILGPGVTQNVVFYPLEPAVVDNAAPQKLGSGKDGFTIFLARSELLTRVPSMLRGVIDIPGSGIFEINTRVTAAAQ